MNVKGRQPLSADEGEKSETLDDGQADDSNPSADTCPSGVFRTEGSPRKRSSGWVLADQFVSAGFHYRVLRKPVDDSGDAPVLTKREADAVELACAGLSNKSIAIELDVSPSTVGVLLFRAAGKLRAKSRTELVEAYRRLRGL